TNFVTRIKAVPAVADDISLGEVERTRGRAMATALSMRVLSRTWQMLLKGIGEVREAGRPLAAAEMVLVRIAYAADLPTPDEAIRALEAGGGGGAPSRRQGNGGGPLAPTGPMSAAPPAQAPRYDTPRGSPRAMTSPAVQSVASAQTVPTVAIRNFAELVALASDKRDIQMKLALERDVRLGRFEDGQLELALEPAAAKKIGRAAR